MKLFWQIANTTKLAMVFMALFAIVINSGCKKDDDGSSGSDDLIVSFQSSISPSNSFQVTFDNYSQNAVSYAWNFGDGNSSTEESPTHIYTSGGTFEVVLTASDASGNSGTKAQTINIVDADAQSKLLSGTGSKTWYMQREGIALGVGTALDNNVHWSFGGVTPLGDRPCILDDKYIFHEDGTFEFDSNNTIFIDSPGNGGWLTDSDEGCFDESVGNLTASTGEDLSAFGNGGSYTYAYNQSDNSLTLNGAGAYIGLANKTSDGGNYVPISTKKYTVFNLTEGTIADTLQISLAPTVGADFWNFYLVSYKNEADLPTIPSAVAAANFSFTSEDLTYSFTNTSGNAISYFWDFGDGNTSTEENPIHTFNQEGEFTVSLTVTDALGNSDTNTQTVVVSTAVFSAAKLSSSTGKVWTLSGDAPYYVGEFMNDPGWWTMTADFVAGRGCQMDDEFIFFDNGDFNYDTKGDVFADEFVCGSATCTSEDDLVAPFDVYASGSHAYEVIEGGENPQIRVIGAGAFLGFNKGINGGEVACDLQNIPSEITYEVASYASLPDKEVLTVSVSIGEVGWWTMVLESVE